MSGAMGEGVLPSSPDDVDAVGRGWVRRGDGPVEPAMFFLAGSSLGVTDIDGGRLPDWYELPLVVNLDAIGDSASGVQPIELAMSDGRVLVAGWPEPFCGSVVDALRSTLALPAAPAPPASADAGRPPQAPPAVAQPPSPVAPAQSPVAPAPPAVAPAPSALQPPVAPVQPATPAPPAVAAAQPATAAPELPAPQLPTSQPPAPQLPAPQPPAAEPPAAAAIVPTIAPDPSVDTVAHHAPEPTAAALVLEDVTYLGGYPGQPKKRKKCTATLTHDAVEFSGPGGIGFRVPWEVVRTIEAQNADEARFRINTKVHRDATALVLECDQDVTILLEARDCPTIPLRNAIAQLVTDLPVVVV